MIRYAINSWVSKKALLRRLIVIFVCLLVWNGDSFTHKLLAIEAITRATNVSPRNNPPWHKAAPLDPPPEQPIEVIVDNDMRGFLANGLHWENVTDLSAYGGTYLRVNALEVSETHLAVWRPDLPLEGEYKVYLRSVNNQGGWHVQFTVHSYDGVFSGVVSGRRASEQTANFGWVHLGTWYFRAGTSGYVTVSSSRACDGDAPWEGGADGLAYVNADAVRFTFSQKPLIVDNSDEEFTNSEGWEADSHSSQFGRDHLFSIPGNGQRWAVWRPNIKESGYYDVFARWVCNSDVDVDLSMTKNATYEINYLGDKVIKNVSQRWVRGVWVYLGTYPFASGTDGFVHLTDALDGKVIADAIKFRKTNKAPPPDRGFLKLAANSASFIFQNGEVFVPVGYNLRDAIFPEATAYYDVSDSEELFARTHANDINILRFWMQDISERNWLFQDGNNFDQSLPSGSINMWYAQRMHDVLYLAEKYDIYLVPVLWDDYYAAEYCWNVDPYNNLHGGPLTDRLYLNRFNDTEAAKIWQERLFRFLAEEFGKNAHIFAWDIGNDFGGDQAWVVEMSTYLRSVDPHHLISYQYSTGIPWPESVVDFVDFLSVRGYPYQVGNDPVEIAKTLRTRIRSHLSLGKPVIVGEFGPLANYEPNDLTSMANVTLYGLWTSITSGALSAWKWAAGYVFSPDLNHLERQYYSAHAKVLRGVNLTRGKWVDASSDIKVLNYPTITVTAIRSGQEMLAWLMDDGIFKGPRMLEVKVNSDFISSMYVWEWIDPRTGQIIETERLHYPSANESTVEFEGVILLHIYSPPAALVVPFIQLLLSD